MSYRNRLMMIAITVFALTALPLLMRPASSLGQRGGDSLTDVNPQGRAFTTQSALAARGTCNRDIGEALDEYRLRVLKAKRTYRDALLVAKQAAMKNTNLDEANAVDAEVRNVDLELQAVASTDAPSPGGPLVITHAQYGIEGHWLDITKLMNSQIHQGRIESVTDLSDPASGMAKMTVIYGTIGGKKFTLQFPEQFPLNHLIFGVPPVPVRSGH
jgi:hypothetical protein